MLNLYPLRPGAGIHSGREPLVKLSFVCVVRGVSREEVNHLVWEGKLRWVFNVAVNQGGPFPDYRFWVREIQGDRVKRLTVEEVVAEILGGSRRFHSGPLCQLLSISRTSLKRLRGQLGGELLRNRAEFERVAVEQFLKGRLYNGDNYGARARN